MAKQSTTLRVLLGQMNVHADELLARIEAKERREEEAALESQVSTADLDCDPRPECLRRVVEVARKRPDLVDNARRGGRSLVMLLDEVCPKPPKAKHGARRLARWKRAKEDYALAIAWWLRRDVVTQLGTIGRLK